MKNLYLLTILICSFYKAQYDYFPKDQSPYVNGIENYYKDFHKILVEKNIKTCSNIDELYNFKVLINPDSTVKYVKETDEKDLQENKCAHDLAREVAKYQPGWNPAKLHDKPIRSHMKFPLTFSMEYFPAILSQDFVSLHTKIFSDFQIQVLNRNSEF